MSGNDNDWQLKKLQHDSLKTSEKVVEVLRETIEREVLAQAKDYERLFGARSAQFAEYLTMVAQKLEQHGIQHEDVINWLTATASEGAVPKDYASDLRDSQSKTVPFIAGGPMQDFGENSLLDRTLNITPPAAPPASAAGPAPAPMTGSSSCSRAAQPCSGGSPGAGKYSQTQSSCPARTSGTEFCPTSISWGSASSSTPTKLCPAKLWPGAPSTRAQSAGHNFSAAASAGRWPICRGQAGRSQRRGQIRL